MQMLITICAVAVLAIVGILELRSWINKPTGEVPLLATKRREDAESQRVMDFSIYQSGLEVRGLLGERRNPFL